jgi:hypothetical protein
MLHVESDWLWYLISGIFGTEILIQAEGLVEVISSGVPPSWADGASVAMVSANVCMAGLAVLTLTLLWRRSQWTRVAIWTWSVPVALVSTWLLVTEIAAFEFESWMFYIGGGPDSSEGFRPFRASSTIRFLNSSGYGWRVLGMVDLGH